MTTTATTTTHDDDCERRVFIAGALASEDCQCAVREVSWIAREALTTPAWASSTIAPEDGSHEGEVTVGSVTLSLGQEIPFRGEPTMIYVWLPEVDRLFGAQACRDLAAALLEAARIIEAAKA
jgi:hypothetical protein